VLDNFQPSATDVLSQRSKRGLFLAPIYPLTEARPHSSLMSSADILPIGLSLLVLTSLIVFLATLRLRRTLVVERRDRCHAERSLERTGQLEALATALLKGRTSLEVGEASLFALLPALGASTATIALVTDDDTELEVMHTLGFAESIAKAQAVPLSSNTLLTDAWRRQDPVIFASQEDRQQAFAHLTVDPLFEHCEAAVVLPLLVTGRALGVVALGFRRPRTSPDDERQFLARAAQGIAHALDRAGRY
jgi:transcriptional regulator with GAF, ATPase, and Fis domain